MCWGCKCQKATNRVAMNKKNASTYTHICLHRHLLPPIDLVLKSYYVRKHTVWYRNRFILYVQIKFFLIHAASLSPHFLCISISQALKSSSKLFLFVYGFIAYKNLYTWLVYTILIFIFSHSIWGKRSERERMHFNLLL